MAVVFGSTSTFTLGVSASSISSSFTNAITGFRAAASAFLRGLGMAIDALVGFRDDVVLCARSPRLDFTLAQPAWWPAPQFTPMVMVDGVAGWARPNRGRTPRRRPLRTRARAVARLAQLRS